MATLKGITVGLMVLSAVVDARIASARDGSAFRWQTSDPEDQGISSAKLDASSRPAWPAGRP